MPMTSRLRSAALAVALALPLLVVGCRTATPASSATPIGEVQGRGAMSPLLDREVAVEGIVTLVFRDGRGGVFVQSLVPDADAATADGVFVVPKEGAAAPAPGTRVLVRGRVAELGDGPGLTAVVDADVETQGEAPLPAPVALAAPPADWEALEGMRVTVDVPLVVSGNDALVRFGEVDLAFGGRLFTPTEQVAPGEPAKRRLAENLARRIVLDDARADENPEAIGWLPAPLSDAAPLRAGSTLSGITGVLDERFGGYRLQAEAPVATIVQAPRPAPPAIEGRVHVAGMNLLNLFNGDGTGGGFPTARGARTPEAYTRQLAKHVASITALDPAIIAAQEMENDGFGPESSIQRLVAALDAAQPGARWQAVAPAERPGTDQISVAILSRAPRVAAVGAPAVLTGGPFAYGSRPPLAQSFRIDGGVPFTLVSVHLKSKGGCAEADAANRDQGDGQACFNAQRAAAAEALGRWASADPTGSGATAVALVGDFNAYAEEDPMRGLREAGWIDPLAGGDPDKAYSFVFDGQAGRLDHVLVNAPMQARLRGIAKWHSNSDESLAFAYDGPLGRAGEPTPWRASDHDPVLFGLEPPAR
ncbi:MAG: ExeM/NucH family extracellular endonuclease [Lysobacteraceae bacterium]